VKLLILEFKKGQNMKNKIFIILFTLVMTISSGFIFGNKAYASSCPVDKVCCNCVTCSPDCCKTYCKNCKETCKQCEKVCECCKNKKTEPTSPKLEESCPCKK